MVPPRLRAALIAAVSGALVITVAATALAAGRRSLQYAIPEDVLERFGFEAQQRVQTELVRLPPEAQAYDVRSLGPHIGDVTSTASGTLERFVGRRFRDQSIGLVSRLVGVVGTVDRGDGASPLDLAALDGKSVSVRMHESGELLDSLGWSHMAGAGRGGELVQEVYLQQILRLPAGVPRGDGALGSTFRLRFTVDPSLERSQDHVIAYRAGTPDPDCPRCLVLDYSGELKEVSRDKHPARPMVLDATGQLEGTVVLGRGARSRPLVSHTWTIHWDRTVRSEREGGAVRGEVHQQVETTGRLWRLEE